MQPNILVILCDQLRKDFLSCYGGTVCNTPNLDALAAKSVCFTNAITASPVCAPARASMMTGRYVSDHGVWTNDMPFREGVDYLPQRMNQAGYRTGAFGKLHHFPAKDGKGFSTYALMEENRLGDKDDYFQWLRARHPEIRGVFTCKKDGGFAFAEDEYYEHWIADRAMLGFHFRGHIHRLTLPEIVTDKGKCRQRVIRITKVAVMFPITAALQFMVNVMNCTLVIIDNATVN